jgi:8-oxo-dGTP pyrophosphatase MutT (NUDIX family)
VPFEKVGERIVHEGAVVTFTVGTFRAPDGRILERDVVKHPGAVSVVPVDGDEVVLVRQYRAALGRDLLEIPAGKRDVPGEPPEVTAVRELEEEIGMRAGHLEPLAEFFNSAGFSDEYSYVYLATDLLPGSLSLQGVEEQHMVVERHRLDEVPGMIERRELVDAKTIIGLLLALRHLGR